MSWLTLSLISVIAIGLAELTQHRLLKVSEDVDEYISGILICLIEAIVFLPLIFILGLQDQLFRPFQPDLLPWFLVVVTFGSVAVFLYLRSFKVENVSISCILISWSVIVSTILGVIFYSESLDSLKLLGIGLVIVAIVILNYRNNQLEGNHLFALLAGVLFGVTYAIDKKFVLECSPVIYFFWVTIAVSIFGMAREPGKRLRTIVKLSRQDWGPILVSTLFYIIFNMCTFYAYIFGGEVGRIDAINNCQVFLIIAVEYFLYKQQEGVGRKLLSGSLALAGIICLGVA